MLSLKRLLTAGALVFAAATAPMHAAADTSHSSAFDSECGKWHVHVTRLLNPGAAAPQWANYDGTHTVMPLLGGRANIGVLEISGARGAVEGLQLRLYDPLTQRWSLSFASGDDGQVQPPSTGRFDGAHGTFFTSERIAGRAALVRTQTVVRGALAYSDVISYSTNGGGTWRPLWIAEYTKIGSDTSGLATGGANGRHDFDFQAGSWHVELARLAKRLSGSHAWRDYEGTLTEQRLWNGRANVGVLEVRSGTDRIESILLRTFDQQSGLWRDYGVDTSNGSVMMPPAAGRFSDGRGLLCDHETINGRPIVVRYAFDDITDRSSRFVQSFSGDGGKSWEPNLIVRFARATGTRTTAM